MIRTLIFGAIAGYVGKKLYDEGKLTDFKDDLVARYNQAKTDLETRHDTGTLSATTPGTTPGAAATHSTVGTPLTS